MRVQTGLTIVCSILFLAAGGEEIPPPPNVSKPPRDAVRSESGLASKVLRPGTGGRHPSERDIVLLHYTAWTAQGKMFDSSVSRGRPSKFQLDAVIPGLTEGVGLMVEGEKRRLWISSDLAYRGMTGMPEGMLVYDIELLEIERPPTEAPDDVAAPPADAERTASGLSSKVLRAAKGKQHPGPADTVEVHYNGWTTSGRLFDSTHTKGRPATFRLDRVIAGWTEGLQLMVPGEKRRFWIPQELAYGGRRGKPRGMLVFDVELLAIRPAPPPPPAD